MRKSSFFAAFLFAIFFTLGTAGHALAHDHDDGHWHHRPAWGQRWRGDRWGYGRNYGYGYANPGWWRRGDDDDWGRRWGGYGQYPYHRGDWWHRHFDRDDD